MSPVCWNDLPEEPLNPKASRKVLHSGSMTVARLTLKTGCVVPLHHHVNEQISTVELGLLRFEIEGRTIDVAAGESLVIPPNVPHAVVALEDSVALDLFSPARADWISGNDHYLRG